LIEGCDYRGRAEVGALQEGGGCFETRRGLGGVKQGTRNAQGGAR
jgi:hypothetical protein